MKMIILEKSKDEILIELDETDMTLLHPLAEVLMGIKGVEIAEYKIGHPELDKPTLHVKMTSGKPETALKNASKALIKTFSDLREQFEKEL
ncbi:MAG: DNA-directed RNA polymerase subunit L [Thermoplasmata archaeon]|nr:DNA-directed RNA polymerase subunit L [Thermoplasmata archaeon]